MPCFHDTCEEEKASRLDFTCGISRGRFLSWCTNSTMAVARSHPVPAWPPMAGTTGTNWSTVTCRSGGWMWSRATRSLLTERPSRRPGRTRPDARSPTWCRSSAGPPRRRGHRPPHQPVVAGSRARELTAMGAKNLIKFGNRSGLQALGRSGTTEMGRKCNVLPKLVLKKRNAILY